MSSPRRTILVALLAVILGATLICAPAMAADDEADLRVSIRSLSPSRLVAGSDVTVTGTVANRNDQPWTNVQAYLVIPASPFTTRGQIDQAIENGNAYTGVRIVDVGTFDEVGDLAAGQTSRFRVTVPWERLGITGAEGVYPIGIQILATDADGVRSPTAVARATTFVPLISDTREPVPTSLVWPFLMADHRGVDGDYANPESLLESVSAGGQLRNLLDLASSTPRDAATIVVDPALLVGVDDLAKGRHQPEGFELTDEQRAEVERFLADLLTLARSGPCWILDFGRSDDLALSENPDLRGALSGALDDATETTLTTYQLTGRRVSWPSRDGVTSKLLADVRRGGERPVIVTPSSVPDWERRLGSIVKYESSTGPVPLVVDDRRAAGKASRTYSVATLRQRLLSDAALATLERAINPESRADAVLLVDPVWDPGVRWATGQLSQAFTAPFTQAASLESLLTNTVSPYDGTVPSSAKATPIERAQLESAADVVSNGELLSSIVSQSDRADASRARDVAEAVAIRWRLDRPEGLAIAAARERRTRAELAKISIDAPPSVTLSSSKGGFPLTISNDTGEEIRVGVDLDSSNPALAIPAVKTVEVGAGESRTFTVQINLGTQRATDLTAHLMTNEGKTFGAGTTFKVRSSSISAVLWVAMGLAGVFVLIALARRFHRRRTGRILEPLADDDD